MIKEQDNINGYDRNQFSDYTRLQENKQSYEKDKQRSLQPIEKHKETNIRNIYHLTRDMSRIDTVYKNMGSIVTSSGAFRLPLQRGNRKYKMLRT